jgi:hypothetical protein
MRYGCSVTLVSCRRVPPRKLASSFPTLPREGEVGLLICVDTDAQSESDVMRSDSGRDERDR